MTDSGFLKHVLERTILGDLDLKLLDLGLNDLDTFVCVCVPNGVSGEEVS